MAYSPVVTIDRGFVAFQCPERLFIEFLNSNGAFPSGIRFALLFIIVSYGLYPNVVYMQFIIALPVNRPKLLPYRPITPILSILRRRFAIRLR